ncbi:MAG TPA: PHP-associated domain-containing protein [Gemmatales bacterium]|nr:PHP-associated domain-containing protein [Gemmatales bacterium]
MIAFDMHLHTKRHSPDSAINPYSLVRRAQQLGLTGVVITEHDWLWSEDELDELRAATPKMQVYAGVEVSACEGHFLCYGVNDTSKFPKGIEVLELCREVHAQGGAIVAAHPYRWGQDFDELLNHQPLLDGLEVMSSNMDAECRKKARTCKQERDTAWAALGNSDAHQLEVVAYCYSVFPQNIRDQADLLEAIRSGDVEARERHATEIDMIDTNH